MKGVWYILSPMRAKFPGGSSTRTEKAPNAQRTATPSGKKPDILRGLPSLDVLSLVASIVSLVLLLPPLRSAVLTVPVLPFAAAFVLFLAPGVPLSAPLRGWGPSVRLPAAFAFSAVVYGVLALPPLLLHGDLGSYLVLCGLVLAASLALTSFIVFRGGASSERDGASSSGRALWLPFLLFCGLLAYASIMRMSAPGEDTWVYLSQVREFLGTDALGTTQPYTGAELEGVSRLTANGWLLEIAALSRISGMDPIPLFVDHLEPVAVFGALVAFVALARVLAGGGPALFAGCLYALYNLATLSFSPLDPGGELVGRAAEDKFLVRYLLLPVALLLVVLFLREGERARRWLLLGLFALVYLGGAVAVHPLSVFLIGIPLAGLVLVHGLLGFRQRETWERLLPLCAVPACLLVPALAYFLVTSGGLPSVLDSSPRADAAYRIYAWERMGRLLVLGRDTYIMSPSLLLSPVVIGGLLLGVPYLVLRLRSGRSIESRLLLGTLLISAVVLYVPPVSTLFAHVIGPWTIWRLSWPPLLAAALAFAFALWAVISRLINLSTAHTGTAVGRIAASAASALPYVLVVALAVAVTPQALRGAAAIETDGETPQSQSDCFDPALVWLQDNLREPTKVLAPDNESSCLPAWSASANVVSYRSLAVLNNEEAIARNSGAEVESSPSAQRIKAFYASPVLDQAMVYTLISRRVDLVVVPADSPLVAQFDHTPAFRRLDVPGERYRIYALDRKKLDQTRLTLASSFISRDRYTKAVLTFAQAPSRGPDDDFIALLGTGRAFMEAKNYEDAIANLEAAVEIDPASTEARRLLAEARNSAGDTEGARRAYEEAIRRDPRNVELRLDYGLMLVLVDPQASIEQHREIVRMYPEVPEYRIKLGSVFGLLGRPAEADRQLSKAVELDPLSPRTHADLGKIYATTGRPQEAIEHYERALELDPRNQRYAYELGSVLARLSAENPGDESLFRKAEKTLKSVDDLEPYSWEADNRAAARIALGDLYASRGRTEDARNAYEEAQRIDGDSGAAAKLEALRGR